MEKLLGIGNLYEPQNMEWNHHVQQALKAHVIFQKDKDYVVKDGEVIIVDEFTGRLMAGPPLVRWPASGGGSQGRRQDRARERKRSPPSASRIISACIQKLAGMTGTAETEAAEFQKIYKLDVTVIPTNRPLIRKENQDVVYRTEEEKFRNAAKEIKEFHENAASRFWSARFPSRNPSICRHFSRKWA